MFRHLVLAGMLDLDVPNSEQRKAGDNFVAGLLIVTIGAFGY